MLRQSFAERGKFVGAPTSDRVPRTSILGARFWDLATPADVQLRWEEPQLRCAIAAGLPPGGHRLGLPPHLLELIVASAGRAGLKAALACRDLREARQRALNRTEGIATFLAATFCLEAPARLLGSDVGKRLLARLPGTDEGAKAAAVLACVVKQLGGLTAYGGPTLPPERRARCLRAFLTAATRRGYIDAVRYLLQPGGADLASDGGDEELITSAVASRKLEVLRLLISAGANAAKHGQQAFEMAVRLGDDPMFAELLAARAPPLAACLEACLRGRLGYVQKLIPEVLAMQDLRSLVAGMREALVRSAAGGHLHVLTYLEQSLGAQLPHVTQHPQTWFEVINAALFCGRLDILRRKLPTLRTLIFPAVGPWWIRPLTVVARSLIALDLVKMAILVPHWQAVPLLLREVHPVLLTSGGICMLRFAQDKVDLAIWLLVQYAMVWVDLHGIVRHGKRCQRLLSKR